MNDNVNKINDEQLRVLANLESAYDAWIQAERALPELKPWLIWRTSRGREYLYELRNRSGYGKSLGPRSPETEALHDAYLARQQARDEAVERSKLLTEANRQLARMYRALRLPVIDEAAGEVLRAADRRGLLGSALLVVGTNTMAAYEIEARHRFATGLDSTADCDFTWAAGTGALAIVGSMPEPIMDMLKEVDDLFTVNTEKPWQARNGKGYEVEILLAPSMSAHYPSGETLRPSSMPEQEWLLLGERISHVVIDRGGQPARIVAPDPRWMALHKQWLADKPGRSRLKVDKDRAQGRALLAAVRAHMPQFPLDQTFLESVPDELRGYLTSST